VNPVKQVLHGQESKAVVCALHDEVQLFHSEVEALKQLSHENIAKILDWGVTGKATHGSKRLSS